MARRRKIGETQVLGLMEALFTEFSSLHGWQIFVRRTARMRQLGLENGAWGVLGLLPHLLFSA
ncbi:MAG: hypothetical protein ACTSXX_04290 [Candidatus Baldrarchaeia archaeon]